MAEPLLPLVPLVTDEFWKQVEPLLPKHEPNPKGGAPPKDNRSCLEGIVHVLRTGTQWQRLPAGERWPSGSTCLATLHALEQVGHLDTVAPAFAQRTGDRRRGEPADRDRGFQQRAGEKGGAHSGPNPVDRGKKGCKRHLITTATGIPLIVVCTPANVRDDSPFLSMLDCLPPVKGPGRGAPRYKPEKVMGDAGYGFEHVIPHVVARRIIPLLAPRNKAGREPVVHGSGLGRVRYVVERTIAWMANFRRIVQCYERTGTAWAAFNELACCVICANKLRKIKTMKMAA